ncbi:hypothetical protein [Halarcobacter sp.]|uniref:hypothetical protein n=1 Tax=Halarcobacter sp. TaxID=2321133 RepID=UPI002AAB1729|nr:hypothetical protein [Halarcobacter sp.]
MLKDIESKIRSWRYGSSTFLIFIFLYIIVAFIDFYPSLKEYLFELVKINFPFLYSFFNQFTLEKILIYIVAIYGLFKLYKNTNKKEGLRYKTFKELKEKYKGEKEKFLTLSFKNKKIINCSSINYLNEIKDLDINDNLKLKNIKFIKLDKEYKVPELIQLKMEEILIDRFNIRSKEDYNGLTLSLKKVSYQKDSKTLLFYFYKSSYYKYLVTNTIPNYEILPGVTIEDYLEASGNNKLNLLEDSLVENHLGISCLINLVDEFSNEYLVIPKRGNNTTVFKGELSPSVSGALNIHSSLNELNDITIEQFFLSEFKEEVECLFLANKINEVKNIFINKLKLIGFSRELKRLGKPELFFKVNIPMCYFKDINKRIISLKNTAENIIDNRENEKVFIIKTSDIKNFINSTNDDEAFLEIDNFNRYKISESLLVNLAYYFR